MARTISRLMGFLRKRRERLPETRYVQHPTAVRLDDSVVIGGDVASPQVLNELAAFVWNQIETPKTGKHLVKAITRDFDVDRFSARAELAPFLQQLVESGLVLEIRPGESGAIPADRVAVAAALLAEAYRRQQAGDWPAALALCVEARKEPACAAIADLDILIGKYDNGQIDGLSEQAKALLPGLPDVTAKLACTGLALLAAYRERDLAGARALALGLARQVEHPVDLPTKPQFVLLVGRRVVVVEHAGGGMVEVVREIRAHGGSDEEQALLGDLLERYERREAETIDEKGRA